MNDNNDLKVTSSDDFMENELSWFLISSVRKLGPMKINRLLGVFSDAYGIVHAGEDELLEVDGVDEATVSELMVKRKNDYASEYYRFREKGIDFYSREHPLFPSRLLCIPDVPAGLFVRGSIPVSDRKAVAIIGSRTCSAYGTKVTSVFAKELARAGIDVISGMALGIDGEAHREAMKNGGDTYAVLGCGVDICYPKTNWDLYDRIPHHGGIISELYPGTVPSASNFPIRNRIISGLSNAVLAVEARNKSGTLITVDQALEQGREVYVIPGRITDRLSDGCNNLLRLGAKPALEPDDIIEELAVIPEPEPVVMAGRARGSVMREASSLSQMTFAQIQSEAISLESSEATLVYKALDIVPVSIEEIAVKTGMSIQRLLNVLGILELDGFVRKVGFGSYMREMN